MKLPTSGILSGCIIALMFFLVSCSKQETDTKLEPPVETAAPVSKVEQLDQLPVQYQKPSYTIGNSSEELDEIVNEVALKVGASIRSTQGPQPLWDILKRLAALKKMSVSWASDVDKFVYVDVDINANDDFDDAITNLLRQVDYYHEIQGSTIVVKYKETRQFHVAMPYTKQLFETATGGNVLGSNEAASNIEGTIRLDSRGNDFNIWENIKLNLDTIMDKWSYRREAADVAKGATSSGADSAARQYQSKQGTDTASGNSEDGGNNQKETGHLQKVAGLGYYVIDQHLGLITVTAPRPILKKIEEYLDTLKKNIYKQVSIEAKILEVQLSDHSSIGLDWNMLMKNISMAGAGYSFSSNRGRNQTRTNSFSEEYTPTRRGSSGFTWNENTNSYDLFTNPNTIAGGNESRLGVSTIITNAVTEGGSAIFSLAAFTFDTFLNAVKEQGQTTILSNPKLSVLNGQPALITVGRNVTYIDAIESDVNNDTGTVSYSVTTQRVLSGVGMALTANILDDNEVVLNLVPVTSELQEPIEYREVGLGQVGLPIINVREMSTTVKVKNGELLVIGGLISNSDEGSGTFVPGTSGIPFLKYLFGVEEKTSRKRELIILLRPKII